MGDLASGTGGLMLNLADVEVMKSLVAAAKKPRVKRQRIVRITAKDVRNAIPPADGPPLSIAVLPHVAFDNMKFAKSDRAEQVAIALREKIKRALPHVKVIQNRDDMEQAVRLVKSRTGLTEDQRSRAVGSLLNVTYIVRGSFYYANGAHSLSTAILRVRDGALLGKAMDRSETLTLVGNGTCRSISLHNKSATPHEVVIPATEKFILTIDKRT